MRPEKNRDGYFTHEEICNQAAEAMAILQEYYLQYEDIFIYDNTSTHLNAPNALSARCLPKNIPKAGTNWGVETTQRNPITEKPEYNPDGKPKKVKVRIADAHFADGTPQLLYFPEGYKHAGIFKGMAIILEERGFGDMSQVWAECNDFKCLPGSTACCCCRILYNQLDFATVEFLVELTCKDYEIKVFFLLKFHCELNFIEQCWGYAKRIYCLNPESSCEDVLEWNALHALESIPLESM